MEERIERYFDAQLNEAEKRQLEIDLSAKPDLADDAAFYLQSKLAAKQVAYDLLLKGKHAQWSGLNQEPTKLLSSRSWISIAAAVLLIVLSVFYFNNPFQSDLNDRAKHYVATHLKELPVHLGDEEVSLQGAIQAYNQQHYENAIALASVYLAQHPTDADAFKVLGLAHLQKGEYDQALDYFQQLSAQVERYSNPGKYYESLSYLLRNQDGDEAKAQQLLEEVIAKDLEGKKDALKLLE
jgi:tetratricopeptide (TPR) repeat protein